ncbi:MAG: HAD-superfamily hydrolase [Promethearchaeota archaeon]|nr:MAG: HAD-superfamily hydrolase [Candidatus Lokiarchaeota archaeon]
MSKINLNEYKSIVFDLDGVIYDINDAIQKAVDDIIEKYNLQVNKNNIMEEIAELIEKLQYKPVPKSILDSYNLLQLEFLKGLSYFKKLRIGLFLLSQFNKYREDSGIFEGIEDVIKKLAEKELNLAILTNNKSDYAEEILEKFNLTRYFAKIIGFNDLTNVKPDPEGLLKIIKDWNVEPEETIFIGDMQTDIKAGKAAGTTVICVASGLAEKSTLLKEEPDYLVDSTAELKALLGF